MAESAIEFHIRVYNLPQKDGTWRRGFPSSRRNILQPTPAPWDILIGLLPENYVRYTRAEKNPGIDPEIQSMNGMLHAIRETLKNYEENRRVSIV